MHCSRISERRLEPLSVMDWTAYAFIHLHPRLASCCSTQYPVHGTSIKKDPVNVKLQCMENVGILNTNLYMMEPFRPIYVLVPSG